MGIWLFCYGVGVGYATAQLTGLILSDVPMTKSGQASGTQSTARQIGSAMGTAVLGTILFVGLYDNTEIAVANTGAPAEVSTQIAQTVEQSAGTAIPALANPPGSPEIQAASAQAFSDALTFMPAH